MSTWEDSDWKGVKDNWSWFWLSRGGSDTLKRYRKYINLCRNVGIFLVDDINFMLINGFYLSYRELSV